MEGLTTTTTESTTPEVSIAVTDRSSSERPRSGTYAFGTAAPSRVPCPAAATTATTRRLIFVVLVVEGDVVHIQVVVEDVFRILYDAGLDLLLDDLADA